MLSDDDSSSLSSPPASDDELLDTKPTIKLKMPTASKAEPTPEPTREPSPEKRKRPASPPHEETLADNPDIAFIVMFRARFSDVFPPKMAQLGPQDIERGVSDQLPSSHVESLLCALLGLVLNRKKYVEKGHYGRALEEAIQTNKHQWPRAWNGINPLHGGRSFNTMTAGERLVLLKTLVLWSLHSSNDVLGMVKESYKQSRHDDDRNQPLSVQPWGQDSDKRRYWLIEGRDDTCFRLYRENNPARKTITWHSIAGSIEELRTVAQRLSDDGVQSSRRLSEKITNAIPRFEATEEKRKRREYRLARKAQFARPEPGFSLYEGRTRGKRMKYTFSEEEDELSEAISGRRSTRHSGRGTPAPAQPVITASGRQVRSRRGGAYGETLLSGQTSTDRVSPATNEYERSEMSEEPRPTHGRATRANRARATVNGWTKGRSHIEGYNSVDEMEDEADATSSGAEWDGGDEYVEDNLADDDDEEMSENMSDDDLVDKPKRSLVVKLKYRQSPGTAAQPTVSSTENSKLPPKNQDISNNGSKPLHLDSDSNGHIPPTANAPSALDQLSSTDYTATFRPYPSPTKISPSAAGIPVQKPQGSTPTIAEALPGSENLPQQAFKSPSMNALPIAWK